MTNPYLNRHPVKDPGEFFGREHEVRWLLERIGYRSPQCCSITGLRRIGKSSLLRFIAHPEGARQRFPEYFVPSETVLMVYADLSLVGPADEDESEASATLTVGHLLRTLAREAAVSLPGDLSQRIEQYRRGSDNSWEGTLDALVDSLHLLDRAACRVIFLLDELDVATAWHPRLAYVLRALVMEHNIAYVTASLDPLFELLDNEGRTSPLYNLFTTRPLGLLEPDEARQMLVKPAASAGKKLSERLVGQLLEAVGGHPDLVKRAGSRLWELLEEGGGEPSLDVTLAALRPDAEALFTSIWKHLGTEERRVVAALAAGQSIDESVDILPALQQRAMIVESEEGVRLFGRLFGEWVGQQPEATQNATDLRIEGRWIFIGGKGQQLTPTEAKLARLLLMRRGHTVSREELLREIWSQADADSKALDTTVQRLRDKIEDDRQNPRWLVTVRGEGYAWQH